MILLRIFKSNELQKSPNNLIFHFYTNKNQILNQTSILSLVNDFVISDQSKITSEQKRQRQNVRTQSLILI